MWFGHAKLQNISSTVPLSGFWSWFSSWSTRDTFWDFREPTGKPEIIHVNLRKTGSSMQKSNKCPTYFLKEGNEDKMEPNSILLL